MGKTSRLSLAATLETLAAVRSLATPNATATATATASSASTSSASAAAVPVSGGMENGGGGEERLPLSDVVGDCVRRWFQDALKEARHGDAAMQVLVAQMYHSGYGVPKNEQKGRAWIEKASRYRTSVWKVGMKRPGYNASDSDSDEVKDDTMQ